MSEDVSAFDSRMLERFRSGSSPMRIAGALNLRVADVRRRLVELGEHIDMPDLRRSSIWEMDEDERRIAIAKTAAKNAAAQRRRNTPRPGHVFRVPKATALPDRVGDELRWTDASRAEVARLLADGFSLTEVGKAMGCSRNAINGMLMRAKQKEVKEDLTAAMEDAA